MSVYVEVIREGEPEAAERLAAWIERDREARQVWREERDRIRSALPPIVHRYQVGDRVRCLGPHMASHVRLGFGDTGTVLVTGGDRLDGRAYYRVEMDSVPENYVSDLTFMEDEISPIVESRA